MDLLRLFTSIFTSLNNPKGCPYWVLSPLRRLTRTLANRVLPYYLKKTVAYSKDLANGVIVSLTSYPGRIGIVWQVIETLKRQSIRPEKIFLWLSKEQFRDQTDIPLELISLQDDVFTIRMVDGDIRSHKKYYYVMQEYPESTIITCDDDIYYHPDVIKHLLNTERKFPGCIVANVTNQLKYEGDTLLPYNSWDRNFEKYSSINRVQIGVGGVLYPAHSLDSMVFNLELLMSLAPLADDLWLNTMARKAKTRIIQSPFHYLFMEIKSVSPSLTSVNNGPESFNDKQIIAIRSYFQRNGYDDVYAVDYTQGDN